MKVITTKNVYTNRVMDLCETHFDAQANGDAQVQHGLHAGECDACAAKMANDYPRLTQAQLDAIAVHMDDDIREDLHSAADWQHPAGN